MAWELAQEFTFNANASTVNAFIMGYRDSNDKKVSPHMEISDSNFACRCYFLEGGGHTALYSIVLSFFMHTSTAFTFMREDVSWYVWDKEIGEIVLTQDQLGKCKASLYVESSPDAWNAKSNLGISVGARFVGYLWRRLVEDWEKTDLQGQTTAPTERGSPRAEASHDESTTKLKEQATSQSTRRQGRALAIQLARKELNELRRAFGYPDSEQYQDFDQQIEAFTEWADANERAVREFVQEAEKLARKHGYQNLFTMIDDFETFDTEYLARFVDPEGQAILARLNQTEIRNDPVLSAALKLGAATDLDTLKAEIRKENAKRLQKPIALTRAEPSQGKKEDNQNMQTPQKKRRLFAASSSLIDTGNFSEIIRFAAESREDMIQLDREVFVKILARPTSDAPLDWLEEAARGNSPYVDVDRRKLLQLLTNRGYAQEDRPKKPGKDAPREDWFRYKYECGNKGTIRFTHQDLARELDLAPGTVRNYYSDWLAENKLEDDTN